MSVSGFPTRLEQSTTWSPIPRLFQLVPPFLTPPSLFFNPSPRLPQHPTILHPSQSSPLPPGFAHPACQRSPSKHAHHGFHNGAHSARDRPSAPPHVPPAPDVHLVPLWHGFRPTTPVWRTTPCRDAEAIPTRRRSLKAAHHESYSRRLHPLQDSRRR
jgi:hypothetical protein